ncbi:hypothetical protein [Kordiimonas aquimaris]|nr:hypothetical protein [Kordiimonas aquimaris]
MTKKTITIAAIIILVAASMWLINSKPKDSSVQKEVGFWNDLSEQANN